MYVPFLPFRVPSLRWLDVGPRSAKIGAVVGACATATCAVVLVGWIVA